MYHSMSDLCQHESGWRRYRCCGVHVRLGTQSACRPLLDGKWSSSSRPRRPGYCPPRAGRGRVMNALPSTATNTAAPHPRRHGHRDAVWPLYNGRLTFGAGPLARPGYRWPNQCGRYRPRIVDGLGTWWRSTGAGTPISRRRRSGRSPAAPTMKGRKIRLMRWACRVHRSGLDIACLARPGLRTGADAGKKTHHHTRWKRCICSNARRQFLNVTECRSSARMARSTFTRRPMRSWRSWHFCPAER